ncbi:breast cancer type 2 susceptibility protein-like isoform X1 [Polistes fuscatus]|uniref:breast cancer type 2 susceptibility protein-like isoform X1 n=1 Tax=Polistes fuscatus TaxID=30207 RepID=UPI001CA99A12|nr:breast cancer type 2 susceptibility protein-like isoform X1 [Polistes fuscatus]
MFFWKVIVDKIFSPMLPLLETDDIPPIGFSTASGKHINVSESAILKAKSLLETDDIPSMGFSKASGKHINVSESAVLKAKSLLEKDDIPSIGFSTASGKHINVSESAISKAKCLLETDDIPSMGFSTASGKHINVSESAISKAKSLLETDDISSMGFSTASGKHINVSESAVLKAKSLLEKDDIPSIGFSTASGKHINVSESAVLKAKSLLEKDDKSSMGFSTASGKHINVSKSAVLKAKSLLETDDISSRGFSTASGKHINVSESAISKAKSLLETDDITSLTNIQLNNESNLHNNHKIKNLSSSLVTVGCQSLNVSNKTLSNAKKILFEQFDDIEINKNVTNELKEPVEPLEDLENINTNLNESSLKENKVLKIGFTTAAGCDVIVSKEALNRAEIFLSDDTYDINQCNNLLNKSINKRKSLHMCDNTADKLLFNTKKVRLSDKDITEEKENQKLYDNTEAINQSNIFSNEIMASTAALLADERDNDQTMEWISQVDNCEKEVPSSPIIGRQPTSRKRGKKRSLQHSIKQKLKPLIEGDISSNVNEENIKCNNTSEKELISMQEINLKPNIDPPINNVTDILQKHLEAISEQENIIKRKKLDRPKAIKGKLLLYKEENHNSRLSWKKLVGNDVPSLCTPEELIDRGISSEILTITSTTALSFKFRCIDFYGEEIIYNNSSGLEMEDGGYLIPDKDNCIGIFEIKRSFLASPGVDPSLIPRDWIENHYKWIIWKLASMDRIKFNFIIIPRSLTPSNIMLQLKYRYDREIDRSQRSCLRRILEKDDCASKRMVLCVSSITESREDKNKESSPIVSNINYWKIILTDRWYSIPAFIDTTMMSYVTSGKIREGTKLMIFGAELLNLDQALL